MNQEKINFITISPDFSVASGGALALHKLADLIGQLGENSFINSATYEGNAAKYIDQSQIKSLDLSRSMFIYPEIIIGNPYNANFVTRWLLNTPGIIGGDGRYDDNDLVYKYYNYFKAPNEEKVKGELRCYDLKLDIFHKKNDKPRIGECFLAKKGLYFGKILDKHSSDSMNLDNFISDEYLSNVFNDKLMFISYDAMTFHSVQAALCGCISIVIPDPGVSREDWIEKCPLNKYGIAYGLSDIHWAKNTMHLVRDHLVSLEKESIQLIKNYVADCYFHISQS